MSEISRVLQQHEVWLSKSAGMVSQEIEYLQEDLADGTLIGLDNVSDSLGMLATYYGVSGSVSVFNNELSGWEDIGKSITYHYWNLKLRAKSFSKKAFLNGLKSLPNLTNSMGNAGCLLAGFIAIGKDDLASSVADILSGMLSVKGVVDAGYLSGRKFEPFMLWLYSTYVGEPPPSEVEIMDLGIYQSVIDSWDTEDDFILSIKGLCDYHCSNFDDTGGDWDPEFKNTPFDLLPLEIYAIYKVRKNLGLECFNIDHQLLSASTASIANIVLSSDDLISEVEIAYKKLFE